jgi:YVTN family beta-propeller protein
MQLDTQIPVGVSPHHPLFTPDGKLGMVVSQGPGTLDLFDPATFTTTGSVKVGTMPHWIGITSDGRWAYVTNENSNDVSVVDMSDRSVKTTLPVGNAPRKIVVQPVATSAAAPSTDSVNIASFAFAPRSLTVKAGQSVSFTNNDSVAHTATSDAWDSGEIQPGGSYTLTAPSTPGTYAYHCSIHPFMTGTLVVQ